MTRLEIPLTRPLTGELEKEAASAVLRSGWLTQGPHVRGFEEAVAEYVGVEHAIACSSGTTALHLALIAAGIGPGDEVIVPSFTWIATANVVRMVGAMPVFVDIDLATFNMALDCIGMAVTDRTKAIMPVHQFGMPADMAAIMALAEKHRLIVVEDAACALGSKYRQQPVGGLGNLSCFSFHPRKVITTGEGGMLVTKDVTLAERARSLRNHGASISDTVKHGRRTVEGLQAEEFPELGYNYRMTDLQGAIGLAQMQRLESILALRRARAHRYQDALATIPYIITPRVPNYTCPNWQSYAIRIAKDSPVPRDSAAQQLLDSGVACRPGYMACHVEPVYRRVYPNLRLPNTEEVLKDLLLLPLYPQMTDEEQDFVIECLRDALVVHGRPFLP